MNQPSDGGQVDPDVITRRAASFGSQAASYAAHRPDYPQAAVSWALEPVRDHPGLRVLDLGAGTGKLTANLADLGVDVVAVEPDPEMLAEFRLALPQVMLLPGSAERIPLPDASVDAVMVGQALHWFDFERAIPEMVRVLRSGGVLAGLWNLTDDRVSWVAGIGELHGGAPTVSAWQIQDIPGLDLSFTPLEHDQFSHTHRRTAESLVATVSTYSHLLVLDEAERVAVLDRLHAKLLALPQTGAGEFDFPLVTAVMRAIRT